MEESLLRICRQAYDAMIAHVLAVYPEEGCGLLGGTADLACRHIAVPNLLHSPSRFRMTPQAQIAAMLALEDEGEQLLALYHSHPDGPASPSAQDMAEAHYPDAAYLVISLAAPAQPRVGAYRLAGEDVAEISWEIV